MAVEKQEAPLSLAEVEQRTILRCEVGSTVHGIGVAGTDDRDELGVCIEPPEYVIGLRHFEQHVHRSKPQGVRSEHGDLDLTIYCHDPAARVLTASLEWREIASLAIGDELISFDSEPGSHARHRHFKTGRVTGTQARVMERVLITTSHGETTVTPDHRFLIRSKTAPRMRWLRASDLRPGDKVYALPMWETDQSWEGGYLAGQFDGEGCLHFSKTPSSQLQWSQSGGRPEVAAIEEILAAKNFPTRRHSASNGCVAVYIAEDWVQQMRFLGAIRPRRLLRHPELARLWEARSLQVCDSAVVGEVRELSPGEMVAMEVDTHTYIADGLLSHNSLRKFCSLALKGNPSILLLFNVPDSKCMVLEDIGRELRDLAWAFASRRAGAAFLGYMQQQRQRLMGERGQMNVKRPELIEKYDWDVKYGSHIIRLGFQGNDYMNTGSFPIPMPDEQRDYILDVRQGKIPENDVLTFAGELERDLKDAIDGTMLPDKPDYSAVNEFLIKAYQRTWGGP
jgi:hypothetical protein